MFNIVRESRVNITKGTNVNLTGWFAAVERSAEFDSVWHEEVLNFIVLCMATGIVQNSGFATELAAKLQKSMDAGNSEAKPEGGMKHAGEATLSVLRQSTKNTYHLGLYILLDQDNQRIERIQTSVMRPFWSSPWIS